MGELLNPCYKQRDARSFCDNTAKFIYTRGWIPVHSTTFSTPKLGNSESKTILRQIILGITWGLQIFLEISRDVLL